MCGVRGVIGGMYWEKCVWCEGCDGRDVCGVRGVLGGMCVV